MNVLLAEANVPYPQLREMEDINPEFDRADVALVVGANDVTNPAARRAGTPVSGMPILDVDHAKSIIVIKRSMGRGYAGIDNELYVNPKTGHALRRREAGPRRPRRRGQGALAGRAPWPERAATATATGARRQRIARDRARRVGAVIGILGCHGRWRPHGAPRRRSRLRLDRRPGRRWSPGPARRSTAGIGAGPGETTAPTAARTSRRPSPPLPPADPRRRTPTRGS